MRRETEIKSRNVAEQKRELADVEWVGGFSNKYIKKLSETIVKNKFRGFTFSRSCTQVRNSKATEMDADYSDVRSVDNEIDRMEEGRHEMDVSKSFAQAAEPKRENEGAGMDVVQSLADKIVFEALDESMNKISEAESLTTSVKNDSANEGHTNFQVNSLQLFVSQSCNSDLDKKPTNQNNFQGDQNMSYDSNKVSDSESGQQQQQQQQQQQVPQQQQASQQQQQVPQQQQASQQQQQQVIQQQKVLQQQQFPQQQQQEQALQQQQQQAPQQQQQQQASQQQQPLKLPRTKVFQQQQHLKQFKLLQLRQQQQQQRQQLTELKKEEELKRKHQQLVEEHHQIKYSQQAEEKAPVSNFNTCFLPRNHIFKSFRGQNYGHSTILEEDEEEAHKTALPIDKTSSPTAQEVSQAPQKAEINNCGAKSLEMKFEKKLNRENLHPCTKATELKVGAPEASGDRLPPRSRKNTKSLPRRQERLASVSIGHLRRLPSLQFTRVPTKVVKEPCEKPQAAGFTQINRASMWCRGGVF